MSAPGTRLFVLPIGVAFRVAPPRAVDERRVAGVAPAVRRRPLRLLGGEGRTLEGGGGFVCLVDYVSHRVASVSP